MKKLIGVLVVLYAMQASAIGSGQSTQSEAVKVIEAFYQSYIAKIHTKRTGVHPPLSRKFAEAIADNEAMCQEHAGDEVCGWAADGDPYIDAQDFDDKLTYKSANVRVMEIQSGLVQVRLNVFPSEKGKFNERLIVYKMFQQEDGKWVVDDILTNNGKLSAQQVIKDEQAQFTKKKK